MKIAIDTSPLFSQSKTRGIGVYTNNLIDSLKDIRGIEVKEVRQGNYPQDSDIVHYPFFDLFFLTLPLLKKKKTVVTIHDCTPLIFPRHYPPGVKGIIRFLIQKFSLRNVSAIITDSQNSKRDIIKYLNVTENKIFVVYLAPSMKMKRITDKQILEKIKEKYSLPQEFVLYVGDVNYNKNLPNIVKSCRMAKMTLVWVGKHSKDEKMATENVEEEPLVEVNKLIGEGKDVLRLGFIDDDELSAIYNQATVYCQPSFYEGFGLQILEAMACGCPVITSNVSSLPEVAGEAAVLINPNETKDIARAIEKVKKDKIFRDNLVKAGFQQVKKFSWQKTAEETVKIYEKVLEK